MAGPWAITAAGTISTAGDEIGGIFDRLLAGGGSEAPDSVSAENGAGIPVRGIPDFDPRRYLKRKGLKHFSRTSQLACAAAARLRDGLAGQPGFDELVAAEIGVVLGTAWASLDSVVRFEREAHTEGPRFVDPILFTETVANVPAGQLSIVFGWSALNATVSSGPASGLIALGQAIRSLDDERARIVVAGGADELNRHLVRSLHAERLAARSIEPPLSGVVPGEGACVLAVESVKHAEARGAPVIARILAEVAGPLGPRPDTRASSIAAMLRSLLAAGERRADQIDLLVLSANGDAERDRAEIAALSEVFGTPTPPGVVLKALLGECWAAAAPIGMRIAAESMRRGVLPPRPRGLESAGSFTGVRLLEQPQEAQVGHAIVMDVAGPAGGAAVLLAAR